MFRLDEKISFLEYDDLQVEPKDSSETSVNFYHTTWRHIANGRIARRHGRENLKYHVTQDYSYHCDPKGSDSQDSNSGAFYGSLPSFCFCCMPRSTCSFLSNKSL
jgi:hypothetical protein